MIERAASKARAVEAGHLDSAALSFATSGSPQEPAASAPTAAEATAGAGDKQQSFEASSSLHATGGHKNSPVHSAQGMKKS